MDNMPYLGPTMATNCPALTDPDTIYKYLNNYNVFSLLGLILPSLSTFIVVLVDWNVDQLNFELSTL